MAWALNRKVISSAYGKRMTRSLCYCLPDNICFCLCVCSQYKATHKRRAWLTAKELCEAQTHRQKNCTPVQSLLHVSTILCQQLCSEKRFPLGYYQLSSNIKLKNQEKYQCFSVVLLHSMFLISLPDDLINLSLWRVYFIAYKSRATKPIYVSSDAAFGSEAKYMQQILRKDWKSEKVMIVNTNISKGWILLRTINSVELWSEFNDGMIVQHMQCNVKNKKQKNNYI